MGINLKSILKKKLQNDREQNIFYLTAIIHIIKYCFNKNFRKKRCLIDPPASFFYKYRKLVNYFTIPLLIFARFLEKKKIFISVNNEHNYSMGHIHVEIDYLQRKQHFEEKYSDSIIWFTTSRKEILGDTKHIFESKNFKILFGGIKRIFLTFVAIKHPSISINGGISHANHILGRDNSNRIVFHNMRQRHSKMITKSAGFYLQKDKLKDYYEETKNLLEMLNITKKYVVIQIKTEKVNATFEILSPDSLLKSIKYFQDKDYQIVFAGREKFPDIFLNKSIIDYANSKYASALNDFLIIGHSSLVIASASGFCHLVEILDKPLIICNTSAGPGYSGRRTIVLPTLLSRRSEKFNAIIQHKYLCTYHTNFGSDIYDDLYLLHITNSEEIYMAAKELESGMLSEAISSLTPLQKEIRDGEGCPLLSCGLSRISDYYLKNHGYFFRK